MLLNRDKPYKGIGMEGRIATWYADNTRKTMAEYRSLADRLASDLPGNSRVLEVAPGPGYLAIALAERGAFQVVGLDISKSFVEIARENARKEAARVDFRHGDASAMPFPDGAFDFIVLPGCIQELRAARRGVERDVQGGQARGPRPHRRSEQERVEGGYPCSRRPHGAGLVEFARHKTHLSIHVDSVRLLERTIPRDGWGIEIRRWRDHRSCYRFGNGADETREAA